MTEFKFKEGREHIEFRDGEFPYLYYPALEETGIVKHLFTTRLGGVSEGYLGTVNLSYSARLGDDPAKVSENYERIGRVLDISPSDMVRSQQQHTADIRIVDDSDRGRGITRYREYTGIDGLMTNIPGICLVTYSADCVLLYFVDPVHKAIALAHSGWRGTVKEIARATLELMNKTYGTDPADVIAAISPSICQDCYEVSEDVIDRFKEVYDKRFHDRIFYGKDNGKYQLDLWEACRITMELSGVKADNIHTANLCTCCNSDLLYSHRASHGKRGVQGAFLCLK